LVCPDSQTAPTGSASDEFAAHPPSADEERGDALRFRQGERPRAGQVPIYQVFLDGFCQVWVYHEISW
jgi:hypothetical protein